MFCDVSTPEREPYEGDPRQVLRRALERAERDGLHELHRSGPELEYFYFRNARPERAMPEVLDEGGYFDLTTLDAGSDVRRETVLALEQLGIHVEYTPPRGRAEPARDRHALRRRAEDGGRLHDVPHHRQGVRHEVRLARDVHAEAAVRRERLRHAHAPVAVPGRLERVLRRDDQYFLSDIGKAFIAGQLQATRARSAPCSPSGSTRTSGSCRATRRRCTARGRAATAPRSCGCRSTTPARSRPRGWSCAARTRPATPT